MTNVAFIGLGVMGLPMAKNLVTAGYAVTAFNRSPEKVSAFEDAGGRGAASIAAAVAGADVIITMLPDSPDVAAVLLGDDGVFAHAKPGAVVVDMSTIAPAKAREFAEAATAAGLRMLDAPVSGGEAGAIEGNLSAMVGGEEAVLDEVREILEAMATTIVRVGESGAGQTVKAANQLIVAATIQVVAEALTFLDAHDVNLTDAVAVLAGGLAGNRILDRKAASMIARSFEPGFRVDLHHKDLGIATEAARSVGVPLPVGSVAAELMTAVRAQGHGDLDHSALLLGMERLAGRG